MNITSVSSCCDEQQIEEIEQQQEPDLELEFLLDKENQSQKRMAICRQCPELKQFDRCNRCSCFMNIKTRLFWAKCPLGKW